MMTADREARNKERTLAFFRAFWSADEAALDRMLAPDAIFLMMPSFSADRITDARATLHGIITGLFSRFGTEEPLACTVSALLADGDEVALEYTARGRTVADEAYENHYSAHVTLTADGLVHALRIYTDTSYIQAKLINAETT